MESRMQAFGRGFHKQIGEERKSLVKSPTYISAPLIIQLCAMLRTHSLRLSECRAQGIAFQSL